MVTHRFSILQICNIDPETQSSTHCGVLEFSAEEGRCYLPGWVSWSLSRLCLRLRRLIIVILLAYHHMRFSWCVADDETASSERGWTGQNRCRLPSQGLLRQAEAAESRVLECDVSFLCLDYGGNGDRRLQL